MANPRWILGTCELQSLSSPVRVMMHPDHNDTSSFRTLVCLVFDLFQGLADSEFSLIWSPGAGSLDERSRIHGPKCMPCIRTARNLGRGLWPIPDEGFSSESPKSMQQLRDINTSAHPLLPFQSRTLRPATISCSSIALPRNTHRHPLQLWSLFRSSSPLASHLGALFLYR